MSYHYQMNNVGVGGVGGGVANNGEFFDTSSYIPQMQMHHHGYQDFYPNDATSSMMTSSVTSSGDGMMQGTDQSYNWRNEWSSATWMPMEHPGSMMAGAAEFQRQPTHCYMEPIAVAPKKLRAVPPPPPRPIARTTPKPFRCHTCGKAFSQAANLTAHKRIHTGEKPFMCPTCNRPFSQSSSLVTHRRTHTGERPYPCGQCEKAFTDSSTLTKHLRTHTGHKPYVCSICMMKFTQSGNLHRHMKTHK